MQRRCFIVLLVPSMIILLLGMWLAFYSHRHGMDTMQRDMEISRQQAVESVDNGIDALFQQASIDSHFTDPDMTVAGIAAALGISGKNLSLFYREQTGDQSAYR